MFMISAIRGDITKVIGYDAIVNAANNTLLGGGGVDGAIHKAAGPDLLKECFLLQGCKTGEAKITKAYNIDCNYIIHTVGPVWYGGNHNEENLLKKSYRSILRLAVRYKIHNIAIPSISTGKYNYPVNKAAKIAYDTVVDYISINNINNLNITWVLFDNKTYRAYIDIIKQFEECI